MYFPLAAWQASKSVGEKGKGPPFFFFISVAPGGRKFPIG